MTDTKSKTLHTAINDRLYPSLDYLVKLRLKAGGAYVTPRAKKITAQSGVLHSKWRGRGMDFDQVRAYQPGDDIRYIDWKASARSGHVYTKLFREERDRPVYVLVDYRESMHFGTRKSFKSVVAGSVAAELAWRAHYHGDKVGAMIFDEQGTQLLRSQSQERAVISLLNALTQKPPEQTEASAQLGDILLRCRSFIKPGSLIFVLSDFSGVDEQATRHLSRLAQHNQIVNICITDPLETAPPPPGLYTFAQGGKEILVDTSDPAVRAQFSAWHEARQQQLEQWEYQYGIPTFTLSTEDDWSEMLMYLSQRCFKRG